MLFCEQSWPSRAPVRRAIIPARRTTTSNNIYDERDTSSRTVVSSVKSSSNGSDDRVHNALLEELCADFGITDSTYTDFLSFDVPVDRVPGVQLPADLEELGEIVSFASAKSTQSVMSYVDGGTTRRMDRPSSHAGLLGVTTTSGMRANIPDDVASPTISSSCEDGKPLEGGGEALSELPPTVHSTTGSAAPKPESDASVKVENGKSRMTGENRDNQSIPPPSSEIQSALVSPTINRPDRDDSATPSPKHVAKKARIIASGGDLLEDVKKSYAFVCGADMFAPPSQPAMSQSRQEMTLGSQMQQRPYSHNVSGYGTGSSSLAYDNAVDYGIQHPRVGLPLRPDRRYDDSSFDYNSSASTPTKGFHHRAYYNRWQTSPASGTQKSHYASEMHFANRIGSGATAYQPDGGQFTHSHYGMMPTTDIQRTAVPYSSGMQHLARRAEFTKYTDQSGQSVNGDVRSSAYQLRGYPSALYGDMSYQLRGHRPHSEFYPPASPYRNVPSNPSFPRGSARADESAAVLYPTHRAGVDRTAYIDQGNHSLAASQRCSREPTAARMEFVSDYVVDEQAVQTVKESRVPYTYRDLKAPAVGQTTEFGLQQTSLALQNSSENICTVAPPNEFGGLSRPNDGVVQQGGVPGSPVMLTPHRNGATVSQSGGPQSGCHSFVRHLIGSGSGPYRSHPLFPLLRDLVIADMNFEAPSFPYPLIAGLPQSFDRLVSNYYSCTSYSGSNTAALDPSVDAIIMDALRFAHSALLGQYVNYRVIFRG